MRATRVPYITLIVRWRGGANVVASAVDLRKHRPNLGTRPSISFKLGRILPSTPSRHPVDPLF
eukprot:1753234-Pyramimonas_sp.AAC.1